MKTLPIIALGLLLSGCSTSTPRTTSLTADQAGAVAGRLANERAQSLYDCQPFAGDAPARFVAGRWLWRDRRACGLADLEATVELAADGSARSCEVILLDSRGERLLLYRR